METMFEPPKDVPGECNARLYVGDDYGDNTSTFRCGQEPGHAGPHRETFVRDREDEAGRVVVEWDRDESAVCTRCGKRKPKEEMRDGVCCFVCPACNQERDIPHGWARDWSGVCSHCEMVISFTCTQCGKEDALLEARGAKIHDDGSFRRRQ